MRYPKGLCERRARGVALVPAISARVRGASRISRDGSEEAVTAGHATAGSEPHFVGRDAELAEALRAAGDRPGLLVVVGPTWVGSTRFAAELAAELAADGAARVRLRGGGPLPDRLGAGMIAAGLRNDPVKSSELRPFTALLDDLADSFDLAWEVG